MSLKRTIFCRNCGGRGHYSESCNYSSLKDIKCHNCNRKGHHSDRCPSPQRPRKIQKVVCYKCNQPGHYSDKCKIMEPSSEAKTLEKIQCYKCNQPGHYSDKCKLSEPSSEVKSKLEKIQCYKCNQNGHYSDKCPNLQKPSVANTDKDNCVICLETRKCKLLLPCKHLCLCEGCSEKVDACPLCRGNITSQEKVFF